MPVNIIHNAVIRRTVNKRSEVNTMEFSRQVPQILTQATHSCREPRNGLLCRAQNYVLELTKGTFGMTAVISRNNFK